MDSIFAKLRRWIDEYRLCVRRDVGDRALLAIIAACERPGVPDAPDAALLFRERKDWGVMDPALNVFPVSIISAVSGRNCEWTNFC